MIMVPAGTSLAELRLPGRIVEVEWLYPFSWDSADRGVVTATRRLGPGDRLCLHAGPYGTADAAAHRDGVGMEFPPTGDGHRYRPDSVLPPQPDDDHQDTAAWLVARVADRYVCLAWEYSGHLIMTVEVDDRSGGDPLPAPRRHLRPRAGRRVPALVPPAG